MKTVKNEMDLCEFGVSSKVILNFLIMGFLLMLPILFRSYWCVITFPLGIYCLITACYLKMAYKYKLTNKKVEIEQGIFLKKIVSIDYKKITDLSMIKYFGWESILVNTAGSHGNEGRLYMIDNVQEIKETIEERM